MKDSSIEKTTYRVERSYHIAVASTLRYEYGTSYDFGETVVRTTHPTTR